VCHKCNISQPGLEPPVHGANLHPQGFDQREMGLVIRLGPPHSQWPQIGTRMDTGRTAVNADGELDHVTWLGLSTSIFASTPVLHNLPVHINPLYGCEGVNPGLPFTHNPLLVGPPSRRVSIHKMSAVTSPFKRKLEVDCQSTVKVASPSPPSNAHRR
jgi:hypothetical protein